jgi:two-component system copper resistance phosphate regulon response regulator CusR
MRVLLAAGDATLGATLARGLLHENVDVAIERSAAAAKDRALSEHFDALVIDADLPAGGGDLCRALRRSGSGVPTVMLIDGGSFADRVRARSLDADAYLTKPVGIRELLAELRARKAASLVLDLTSERMTIADLTIDMSLRGVFRAGQRIDLTSKEFALLQILARNPGTIVDRQTIATHVWGGGRNAGGNVLEVLVRRLRRKIDDAHELKLVQTLRGKGYRLTTGPRSSESAVSADVASQ